MTTTLNELVILTRVRRAGASGFPNYGWGANYETVKSLIARGLLRKSSNRKAVFVTQVGRDLLDAEADPLR